MSMTTRSSGYAQTSQTSRYIKEAMLAGAAVGLNAAIREGGSIISSSARSGTKRLAKSLSDQSDRVVKRVKRLFAGKGYPRSGMKGGYYTGPKGYNCKKPKNLKEVGRRFCKIEKRLREGETTYDHRYRGVTLIDKPLNENETDVQVYFGKTSIDNVVDQLEYWDAATNTWTPRNLTGSTTQKMITIDYVKTTVWLKNNYQVPTMVEVDICYAKKSTNNFPNTDYDAGIAKVVTDPATMLGHHQLIKLADSPNFKAFWSIKKKVKKLLMPGQTLVVSQVEKNIPYEPATITTDVFQKKLRGHVFVIRQNPHPQLVAHSAAGTLVGIARSAVDVVFTQRVLVKYDGGINATRLHVVDTSQAIGSSALTGIRPISDNQAMTHT